MYTFLICMTVETALQWYFMKNLLKTWNYLLENTNGGDHLLTENWYLLSLKFSFKRLHRYCSTKDSSKIQIVQIACFSDKFWNAISEIFKHPVYNNGIETHYCIIVSRKYTRKLFTKGGYPEPSQPSKMELFTKTGNSFQLHLKCSTGFWIRLCMKTLTDDRVSILNITKQAKSVFKDITMKLINELRNFILSKSLNTFIDKCWNRRYQK